MTTAPADIEEAKIKRADRNFRIVFQAFIFIAAIASLLVVNWSSEGKAWENLGDLGSLVAGLFAPLALIYVARTFVLQRHELEATRKALLDQEKQLRAQADALDGERAILAKRLAIEEQRYRSAVEPQLRATLIHSTETGRGGDGRHHYHLRLENFGPPAFDVEARMVSHEWKESNSLYRSGDEPVDLIAGGAGQEQKRREYVIDEKTFETRPLMLFVTYRQADDVRGCTLLTLRNAEHTRFSLLSREEARAASEQVTLERLLQDF